jgi:DNA-binding transcriptional ArsR family regulator
MDLGRIMESFVLLSLGRRPILAKPDRILDSPSRRAILAAVRASPGLTMSSLKRRTGYSWGLLYHHVHLLERSGHVTTQLVGRRRVLYPAEAPLADPKLAARILLEGETLRIVARAIVDHPGASMAEVVRASSASPRAAYYHVRRLLDAGLIVSESRVRYMRLRATRLLEELLSPEPPAGQPA